MAVSLQPPSSSDFEKWDYNQWNNWLQNQDEEVQKAIQDYHPFLITKPTEDEFYEALQTYAKENGTKFQFQLDNSYGGTGLFSTRYSHFVNSNITSSDDSQWITPSSTNIPGLLSSSSALSYQTDSTPIELQKCFVSEEAKFLAEAKYKAAHTEPELPQPSLELATPPVTDIEQQNEILKDEIVPGFELGKQAVNSLFTQHVYETSTGPQNLKPATVSLFAIFLSGRISDLSPSSTNSLAFDSLIQALKPFDREMPVQLAAPLYESFKDLRLSHASENGATTIHDYVKENLQDLTKQLDYNYKKTIPSLLSIPNSLMQLALKLLQENPTLHKQLSQIEKSSAFIQVDKKQKRFQENIQTAIDTIEKQEGSDGLFVLMEFFPNEEAQKYLYAKLGVDQRALQLNKKPSWMKEEHWQAVLELKTRQKSYQRKQHIKAGISIAVMTFLGAASAAFPPLAMVAAPLMAGSAFAFSAYDIYGESLKYNVTHSAATLGHHRDIHALAHEKDVIRAERRLEYTIAKAPPEIILGFIGMGASMQIHKSGMRYGMKVFADTGVGALEGAIAPTSDFRNWEDGTVGDAMFYGAAMGAAGSFSGEIAGHYAKQYWNNPGSLVLSKFDPSTSTETNLHIDHDHIEWLPGSGKTIGKTKNGDKEIYFELNPETGAYDIWTKDFLEQNPDHPASNYLAKWDPNSQLQEPTNPKVSSHRDADDIDLTDHLIDLSDEEDLGEFLIDDPFPITDQPTYGNAVQDLSKSRHFQQTKRVASTILSSVIKKNDRTEIHRLISNILREHPDLQISSHTETAINSMIDLAITAQHFKILDTPQGISSNKLSEIFATIFLHNSPEVQITTGDLTHVPMVTQGTVEAIIRLRNQEGRPVQPNDLKLAFLAGVFHDGGKYDVNIRTETGFTILADSWMNNANVDIRVLPNETIFEALERLKLSKDTINAPFLIPIMVHHDSINTRNHIYALIDDGTITLDEADVIWESIQNHGFVSSWIMNNSGVNEASQTPYDSRSLRVLSHVMSDKPAFERYNTLFREITYEMQNGNNGLGRTYNEISQDPAWTSRILELQEIHRELAQNEGNQIQDGLGTLGSALRLGDHTGQIDVKKYMFIHSTKNYYQNRFGTILEILTGKNHNGESIPKPLEDSVIGTLITHRDEILLLNENLGRYTEDNFNMAIKWLQETDPNKPGLMNAIFSDQLLKEAFDNWKIANEKQSSDVLEWLDSTGMRVWIEDPNNPGGKIKNPYFTLIERAIEKEFYDFYSPNSDSTELSRFEFFEPTREISNHPDPTVRKQQIESYYRNLRDVKSSLKDIENWLNSSFVRSARINSPYSALYLSDILDFQTKLNRAHQNILKLQESGAEAHTIKSLMEQYETSQEKVSRFLEPEFKAYLTTVEFKKIRDDLFKIFNACDQRTKFESQYKFSQTIMHLIALKKYIVQLREHEPRSNRLVKLEMFYDNTKDKVLLQEFEFANDKMRQAVKLPEGKIEEWNVLSRDTVDPDNTITVTNPTENKNTPISQSASVQHPPLNNRDPKLIDEDVALIESNYENIPRISHLDEVNGIPLATHTFRESQRIHEQIDIILENVKAFGISKNNYPYIAKAVHVLEQQIDNLATAYELRIRELENRYSERIDTSSNQEVLQLRIKLRKIKTELSEVLKTNSEEPPVIQNNPLQIEKPASQSEILLRSLRATFAGIKSQFSNLAKAEEDTSSPLPISTRAKDIVIFPNIDIRIEKPSYFSEHRTSWDDFQTSLVDDLSLFQIPTENLFITIKITDSGKKILQVLSVVSDDSYHNYVESRANRVNENERTTFIESHGFVEETYQTEDGNNETTLVYNQRKGENLKQVAQYVPQPITTTQTYSTMIQSYSEHFTDVDQIEIGIIPESSKQLNDSQEYYQVETKEPNLDLYDYQNY